MTNTSISQDFVSPCFSWLGHSRYYNLYIQPNLFGTISVIKTWGSRVSNRTGHQIITCNSMSEAIKILQQVSLRRYKREYTIMSKDYDPFYAKALSLK